MKNCKCQNCDNSFDCNLEFCPQCGFYNESFDKKEKVPDQYNASKEEPIESVVRTMAKNISTIKNIMVFFTVLWIIGVVIGVIFIVALK